MAYSSLFFALYRLLTSLSLPVLRLWLLFRLFRKKEDAKRLPERYGKASISRPQGLVFWIHAASVGEAQSALMLITSLTRHYPSAHVLVTSGTRASATLMQERLPHPIAFHQYIPLDHPLWIGRFLKHWHPDAAFFMESEIWPNLLAGLRKAQIPAFLVNARLSERSAARWKHAHALFAELMEGFSLLLAQTQEDAKRFIALGVAEDRVVISDNIKYSAAPLPVDLPSLETIRSAIGKRPVWLYASTHEGEEALAGETHKILQSHFPNLLTLIVPRHPSRRETIRRTLESQGLSCTLRSEHPLPDAQTSIYVADTLGELGLFYSLAPVAMIGRSFSDDGGGGHNPIEAAQLGCAVLTGPNVIHQKQLFDEMIAAQAALILQEKNDLAKALRYYFSHPDALFLLRQGGRAFSRKKENVIENVMALILPVLEKTMKKGRPGE